MRRRTLVVVAILGIFLLLASGPTSLPAQGQAEQDFSFTGSIVDSYGAKVEAVAGLAYDPIFAYAQNLVVEPGPLATGHGYVVFPGVVAASTIITCCTASPDYPRFGGRLPLETICGDPGNDRVSQPEIRDPGDGMRDSTSNPPGKPNPRPGQQPLRYDCNPGPGCGVIHRGNPVSDDDPRIRQILGDRATFGSAYAVTKCDSAGKLAQTDQRIKNVAIFPMGGGGPSAAGGAPSLPTADLGLLPGLLPSSPSAAPARTSSSATAVPPYSISASAIRMFARTELLGEGTPNPRMLGTVVSRVSDLVIVLSGQEVLRIGEISVVGEAEANGKDNGAKTRVTRTVRGIKVLGDTQRDLDVGRVNSELARVGLSIALGDKRTSEDDAGTSASVDAAGLVIHQSVTPPLVGGVQSPEYRLTLGRATPSVSFFSFSFGGDEEFGEDLGGDFGNGTDETSLLPDTGQYPSPTGVPGVTRVAPGKYLVQGTFAGLDFGDVKIKLWPARDILEALGGGLLLAGLALAARHRRRFI